LTERGIKQCKALAHDPPSCIETAQLLVVSPMQRTLQTATYSFPSLMGKIPWVACELIRERSGLHPCDRRRNLEEYKHLDKDRAEDLFKQQIQLWKDVGQTHLTVKEIEELSFNVYNNDKNQYTSVMYKSFSLLNKKQLIKMTGQKHKYKNKDELIVIAMYKFMVKSIEKSDSLPKGIKIFVLANKKMMKEELLELYKIPSNETSDDEREIVQ
jgi:hypothetical protein